MGVVKTYLNQVNELLSRVRNAPLKPVQKLVLLRSVVIPQLFYQLAVDPKSNACILWRIDRQICTIVKNILHLPSCIHFDYFYVNIHGLGLSNLCESVFRQYLH